MKSTLSSFTGFRSASSWFELYAAFSTFMMLLRTAINDLIPSQVRCFITTKLESFFSNIYQSNNTASLTINRIWDESSRNNELYQAACNYLPSRVGQSYKSLKIGKLDDCKDLMFAVDATEEVVDEFEGMKFTWMLDEGSSEKERRDLDKVAFKLSFNEKHREIAMKKYIPHVLKTYEEFKSERKILKLNSWSNGYWGENELSHPATFETLGLDPELKQRIINDLERFLKRKEMYKRVGKPWKRGYLLYGPPGTGKSSLIAAMANYLKFDVYDLDLNSVYSNSDLMNAMRSTTRRSIIVLEDIDCNKEVNARSVRDEDNSDCDYTQDAKVEDVKVERFTLSGLLNCMDGLWSSHGEERIIIFTTNHVEKIDPALLRPGRMDMHINLSFLKPKAFRILASNYFNIGDKHPLFEQIEELLEKTEFTPAEVAEQLMRNEDPDIAMEALLKFLSEIHIERGVKKG
ncbi:hypothetical protein Lal_00031860 [Lupinus albus]|uniref:Putative ATPase, AAA-type, core, AAA-type ATPase domain-containing protein n=1 Tax=Lupinus albus TaxID=3870 RepID=A0A6A5LTU1_LUPAL|nr:putative ATPase, AAA-type, core, AAA-type ATPase domain-containing protein [Lupinus albus]KAF1864896.1 hypothetical protein Lal_00031860 [Lupinus albus]